MGGGGGGRGDHWRSVARRDQKRLQGRLLELSPHRNRERIKLSIGVQWLLVVHEMRRFYSFSEVLEGILDVNG